MIDTATKPKTETGFNLIPCIFANGEDDDLPGFIAAMMNKRVLVIDDIAEPDEDITLEGLQLVFSRSLRIISIDGVMDLGSPDKDIVEIRLPLDGRTIKFSNCHIHLTD